jgi:hypothetical protein
MPFFFHVARTFFSFFVDLMHSGQLRRRAISGVQLGDIRLARDRIESLYYVAAQVISLYAKGYRTAGEHKMEG